MSAVEKREAVARYFKKFPLWALGLIGVGILIVLIGGLKLTALWGVLACGLGGLPIYFHVSGMISDAKYDQILDEAMDHIAGPKALGKWGIDEGELRRTSVYVYGPAFNANTGNEAFKSGEDGVGRYNPVRFAVIGFGEHQLFGYTGILDLMTGNVLNEGTDEFFYQDVVSVSTATQSIRARWKGVDYQLNDTEAFVLTTSGGTAIHVPIRSRQWASLFGGGEGSNTLAERAIAAVRAMLRDKKRAVV